MPPDDEPDLLSGLVDKGPLFYMSYDGECEECLRDILAGEVGGYVDNDLLCQDCWEKVP